MLVLFHDEPVRLADIFIGDEPPECLYTHARLWYGLLSNDEWDGLLSAIRVIKKDNQILMLRESGKPVSLAAHLASAPPPTPSIHPEEYNVNVPPTSLAGIALREISLLGIWHEEHIILDCAPFLRMSEGWLLGGAAGRGDALVAPAYVLAELDYSRDMEPSQRADLYQRSFEAIVGLRSPNLRVQLLLRLREDIRKFSTETVSELLSMAAPTEPTDETYVSVINELWRYGKGALRIEALKMAKNLRQEWPSYSFDTLDPGLRRAD
jgi:hypothetical protein